LSFILFTPPVAFVLLEFSRVIPLLGATAWLGNDAGVTSLLFGVSIIFVVLSLTSLWCYSTALPKNAFSIVPLDASSTSKRTPQPPPQFAAEPHPEISVLAETRERINDVADGFRIVMRERALCLRLIFLALETALEDSMVSVVIPIIALHSSDMFSPATDSATANLWAVCIIAVGKIGGLLSGLYMSTRWNPPLLHQRHTPYKFLFWCVLMSSLSVTLLPLARFLCDRQLAGTTLATTLVFASSFFFFVFSTAPKIGFATLLQSLVASQQIAGRVFGFVGTFVTLADAAVIFLINSIFVVLGPRSQFLALLVVTSLYLVHGLVEACFGPQLVLLPSTLTSARPLYFDSLSAAADSQSSQSYPIANSVSSPPGARRFDSSVSGSNIT